MLTSFTITTSGGNLMFLAASGVPEPSALILSGLGLVGLLIAARRRKA